MDALTIAFTKPSYIQYLNNLHARIQKSEEDYIDLDTVELSKLDKSDRSSVIYAIERKELHRTNGKLVFNPPMPLNEFRAEAKRQLESILVSIKEQSYHSKYQQNKSRQQNAVCNSTDTERRIARSNSSWKSYAVCNLRREYRQNFYSRKNCKGCKQTLQRGSIEAT